MTAKKDPKKKTPKIPKGDPKPKKEEAAPVVGQGGSSRIPKERDARIPPVGTEIAKRYKGRELKVVVLDQGFQFEGETYSSLSKLARVVTGQKSINGVAFFGLNRPPEANE